jgi:ribosomal protein S18 acetylase RimI-like enzyme
LHESDLRPNSNFAIPRSSKIPKIRENLLSLRKLFEFRGRKPRIEFLAEYSPSIAKELPSNNFFEVMRMPLVCCHSDKFQDVLSPTSITTKEITNRSPISEIKDILVIQRECFGHSVSLAEESLIAYRESMTISPFLALLDSKPVAVVFLGPRHDGIAEIIGLATMPRFRRRGIATSLLTAVFRRAFDDGVDLLFASAGSDYSFRALIKIGSFPCATLVGYGWRFSDEMSQFHNSVWEASTSHD